MKPEYENESYNAKIYDDGDGDFIFQCCPKPSLPNIVISFNVSYLKRDSFQWFCDVVGSQIFHMATKMINTGVNDTQNKIKSALGIV